MCIAGPFLLAAEAGRVRRWRGPYAGGFAVLAVPEHLDDSAESLARVRTPPPVPSVSGSSTVLGRTQRSAAGARRRGRSTFLWAKRLAPVWCTAWSGRVENSSGSHLGYRGNKPVFRHYSF